MSGLKPHDSLFSQYPSEMDTDAFYGLAGDIVRVIEPHTEADPSGLLVQLLVAVGNAIGPSPSYRLEATRHGTNLFAVLVGDTAKARKGTSWNWVKRVVRLADPDWSPCIVSGCSSGEGIIYNVRDDAEGNALDRRLMVIEGEFAQVLKIGKREGNILSTVLRNAWDGGVLRTLTVTNPLTSTDAHISLIGHITAEELLRHFGEIDQANGLGNRFLWVCVRRSKFLPFGGELTESDLVPLATQLREAFMFARKGITVRMDDQARNIWSNLYSFMGKSTEAGVIGAMTARAEAQIIRLACLYALLDKSETISGNHIFAAKAVADYSYHSVKYLFQSVTGNRIADDILKALDTKPKLSRTEVNNLGGRHWKRRDIDDAIELLVGCDDYHVTQCREPTGGRHKEWLIREVMQ